MSFIEINNLEKIYPNGVKAVHDFNLKIDKNEFIVIVGPSGCGKSTTLRMIGGLEDISSGELIIDGELCNYKPSKDRKIAIVFQSYALYPQMNVYQNIAFPLTVNKYPFPVVDKTYQECADLLNVMKEAGPDACYDASKEAKQTKLTNVNEVDFVSSRLKINKNEAKTFLSFDFDKLDPVLAKEAYEGRIAELAEKLVKAKEALEAKGERVNEKGELLNDDGSVKIEYRKMNKEEIEKKVHEAAKILNLGAYLDRLPKELSGGQMQRVALGRAIVKNVPIFLMDEPLSNLDAKLRLTMRSEIVKLHDRINATTIYVTHDQTEAMTMADRIVVMSNGFIQQIGTPNDVYAHPANLFVAKFIGAPSMNILEAKILENDMLIGEDYRLPLSEDLKAKASAFYQETLEEAKKALDFYEEGEEGRNYILKVLSAKADKDEDVVKRRQKKSKVPAFIKKIAELFKKKEAPVDTALLALKAMIEKLSEASRKVEKLTLGIRPENLVISVAPSEGAIAFKPQVVELLGDEYHIHFDFNGYAMVGKAPSKTKISKEETLYLKIPQEDLYVFDPITGGRVA